MSIEAYYPDPLPLEKSIDEDNFNKLIMDTNLELGRFDGMLKYNSKKDIVKAFLRAEEVLSAASLEISELSFDEYMDKLLDKGYQADDLVEIRFMLDYYIEQNLLVEEKGFSLNTLNNFQEKILENREKRRLSQDKLYRTRQTWLAEATEEFDMRLYIHTCDNIINDLMDNLDNFIRSSKLEPLITAAIAYGQLVMIHPWRYANGRITGALIPYMFNFLGITRERSFYLSGAFRKNKEEYYHQLVKLFKEKDWLEWIEYFINKVKEQAIAGQKKVEYILDFYIKIKKDWDENFNGLKFSRSLNAIMSHPIFTPRDLERECGFKVSTLNHHLYKLQDAGYFRLDNRRRFINYMVSDLFTIFNM
jgi:Fic family protein